MSGLSVIIPTHHRLESIRRLIHSISLQKIDFNLVEVIIISNFKDRALEDYILHHQFPFKILLDTTHQQGVNIARNRGVTHAVYDLLLFLDDDVEMDSRDYLQHILLLDWSTGVAAIGGQYVLNSQASVIDQVYHQIAMGWFMDQDFSQNKVLLLGGNTVYNYYLLGKELQFDESIVFGGAETELNLRLLSKGYQLSYHPQMNLIHNTSLNFSSFVKKAYLQGRGKGLAGEQMAKDHFLSEPRGFVPSFLYLIYRDFFYLGKCLAMRKTEALIGFFIYLLKWRIVPLPLALILICLGLFFPLPLVGISVLYIEYWNEFLKRAGLKII